MIHSLYLHSFNSSSNENVKIEYFDALILPKDLSFRFQNDYGDDKTLIFYNIDSIVDFVLDSSYYSYYFSRIYFDICKNQLHINKNKNLYYFKCCHFSKHNKEIVCNVENESINDLIEFMKKVKELRSIKQRKLF